MTICMTRIKKEKIDYKQFTNARLEPELQEWLKSEKGNYISWNLFFREIKRRYEHNHRGVQGQTKKK